MSNIIAQYIAELNVRVKDAKLNKFNSNLSDLQRKMHNAEVDAKKLAKQLEKIGGGFRGGQRAVEGQKKLNQQLKEGNRILAHRSKIQRSFIPKNTARVSRMNTQAVYNNLFGQKGDVLKDQIRERLYQRRRVGSPNRLGVLSGAESKIGWRLQQAEAARLAIQKTYQDAAKRFQREREAREKRMQSGEMAHTRRIESHQRRIAEIKERGAQRMAAIELQASLRNQMTGGGGIGRGGFFGGRSFMGGAAMGGAFGATMSSMSGIIPGVGLGWGLTRANQINQELISNKLALTAITGSEESGLDTEMRFRERADALGISWRDTQPAFRKMLASGLGSGMTQEQVEGIFQGTAEYGRVMGLDSESMKGSMRALEQIMNKQQVMSEELKLQLAERMPGVIAAMAEAYGNQIGQEISTQDLFKAMEDGEVKSDVLVEFAAILSRQAREGGALERAMKTSAAEQGRFNNSVDAFIEVMGKNGLDKGFFNIFNELGRLFKENEDAAEAFGKVLVQFSILFSGIIRGGEEVIKWITKLGSQVGLTGSDLMWLGTVITMLLAPFTRWIAIISGLLLVVEDLSVWARGGNSFFKELFEGLTPETQEQLVQLYNNFKGLATEIGKLFALSASGWSKLFEYFHEEGGSTFVLTRVNELISTITRLLELINILPTLEWEGIGVGFTTEDSRERIQTALNSEVGKRVSNWDDNYSTVRQISDGRFSPTSGTATVDMGGVTVNVSGLNPEIMADPNFKRDLMDDLRVAVEQATVNRLREAQIHFSEAQ